MTLGCSAGSSHAFCLTKFGASLSGQGLVKVSFDLVVLSGNIFSATLKHWASSPSKVSLNFGFISLQIAYASSHWKKP